MTDGDLHIHSFVSVLSDSSQTVLEHHNLDIIFGYKVDISGSLYRYTYVLLLYLQRNIKINIHKNLMAS